MKKFLQKPVVALLLALLIVVGSTLLSADLKLTRQCEKVINGFYDGVKYDGVQHPSIASCLSELCDLAEQMVVIANNYGLETEALTEKTEGLRLSISYRDAFIRLIYSDYSDFNTPLMVLEDALNHTELSDRHSEQMALISEQIAALKSDIASSGYNETVNAFLRRNAHFPTEQLADLLDIDLPELFA